VAATISTTLAVLPVFLLGGLAVFIRDELGFGQTRLGAAVSLYFGTSALASVPGGRVGERLGAGRAMTLAAAGSAVALLGIATLTRSWGQLVAFLALAGCANAVAQPAGNAAISRGVPPHRQGLAFGLKQSAVPTATLLAGFAVPLLGLTVGWRWAFAGGALAAASFAFTVPSDPSPDQRSGRRLRAGDAPLGGLVALALAGCLGSASANALGAFLVDSAVAGGMPPGRAGLLLSLGGLTGVGARLLAGWLADHREGRHLPFVSGLLAAGAVGFGLIAGGGPFTLVAGTLLAFGAGWGWNGLFIYAVVRQNRNAPAAATGITQAGVFLGGVVGPLAFGATVERLSYPAAWLGASAVAVLASVFMLLGRWLLLRQLSRVG
jgi:MFS family permease